MLPSVFSNFSSIHPLLTTKTELSITPAATATPLAASAKKKVADTIKSSAEIFSEFLKMGSFTLIL